MEYHNIIFSKELQLEDNQNIDFYQYHNLSTKQTNNLLVKDKDLYLIVKIDNSNSAFIGNYVIESKIQI